MRNTPFDTMTNCSFSIDVEFLGKNTIIIKAQCHRGLSYMYITEKKLFPFLTKAHIKSIVKKIIKQAKKGCELYNQYCLTSIDTRLQEIKKDHNKNMNPNCIYNFI